MSRTVINGKEFYFGLNERQTKYGSVFPIFSDKIRVLDRSVWKDFSLRKFVPRVLDQGKQSSCVAASTVSAIMTNRIQCGFPDVELSIGSIYGLINRGADNGAFLSDGLLAAHKYGACPTSIISHYNWDISSWPSSWKDVAKCYRILEAYDCSTFDEIVSAILYGFVVCYGIFLSSADIRDVGKDGFLPVYNKGRSYGHAILGVGIKKYNNLWWIESLSSWGTKWANDGFCFVPSTFLEKELLDAWAIRVSTVCPIQNSISEAGP